MKSYLKNSAADLCPKVKGTIANKGCPEIAREDIVKISLIASNLFFETNSDKLKVASLTQLDDLVVIMNRYQDAKLLIEGHTDSQGNDEFNLDLSSRRAASVKKYLEDKGINSTRLTTSGLGESKPVADNLTNLGRAKNRRVELKTSY